MRITEQVGGYLPHPANIRGCCWWCQSSQRDIEDPDAPGGIRKERVFNTGIYLEANEQDRYDLLGLGPAGVPALCETCLRDAAKSMLAMITLAEYASMKVTAERAQMLDANLKIALHAKERLEGEVKDLTDRLEWKTTECDLERERFTSLANLDHENRDEAVVLREELATVKQALKSMTAQRDNRDAMIDALRRGDDPPAIKRPPGRPPAHATA